MNKLTEKQMLQEDCYDFPYHYLDLKDDSRTFWNLGYLSLLEIVKNLVKPYRGQLILDAGCGDGRLCYELKKENLIMVGVDASERAIRFAKAFNPDVEFFVQDMERLNVPYKFDYVILIETLEHFFPKKIPLILQNLSNVLKEDGKLIITVPSTNKPLRKKHYQHFSQETLVETLQPYFKIVQISGFYRISYRKYLFFSLLGVGLMLYPFWNKIGLIERYYIFLKNYFKKNLAVGDASKCNNLIAVCEKVTKYHIFVRSG